MGVTINTHPDSPVTATAASYDHAPHHEGKVFLRISYGYSDIIIHGQTIDDLLRLGEQIAAECQRLLRAQTEATHLDVAASVMAAVS